MTDINLGDLINGGAAVVALHLATQVNATLQAIKTMLAAVQAEVKDLGTRVTKLETPAAGGPQKKARRAPVPRPRRSPRKTRR